MSRTQAKPIQILPPGTFSQTKAGLGKDEEPLPSAPEAMGVTLMLYVDIASSMEKVTLSE